MELDELIKKLEALREKHGGKTKFEVYNAAHETFCYWTIIEGKGGDNLYDNPPGIKKGVLFIELIAE